MKDAELRAAADRFLGEKYSGEMYEEPFRRAMDARLLAAAYLTEHPADDAEPVTREWLLEASVDIDDDMVYRFGEAKVIIWPSGRITLGVCCHESLIDNPTRGQVRRLYKALRGNQKPSATGPEVSS